MASPDRFQQRRERNRAALLEAAIELFQEQGTRATKVEDICVRADVAKRTFFNHFETREHLTREIALERAEQLAARIDARSREARPLEGRLLSLFQEIGAYLEARPAYRELVAEMLALRFERGGETTRDGTLGLAARRFVEEAMRRGEWREALPPAAVADLLLGALTTAIANWCASDDFALEEELCIGARILLTAFHPQETS